MIPAMSNRREKSAITGSEPSRFSNTSTTAICARGRIGTRRGCFEIPIRGKLDDHASVTHVAQTHVRKTGLAGRGSPARTAWADGRARARDRSAPTGPRWQYPGIPPVVRSAPRRTPAYADRAGTVLREPHLDRYKHPIHPPNCSSTPSRAGSSRTADVPPGGGEQPLHAVGIAVPGRIRPASNHSCGHNHNDPGPLTGVEVSAQRG